MEVADDAGASYCLAQDERDLLTTLPLRVFLGCRWCVILAFFW